MTWSYADWASQSTDALRLARIRLHIAEVGGSVETRAVGVGADGKSLAREGVTPYLQMLFDERDRLERAASRANAGGRSHVRLDRP